MKENKEKESDKSSISSVSILQYIIINSINLKYNMLTLIVLLSHLQYHVPPCKDPQEMDFGNFDIPIFTEEFLDHNKVRDSELR